MYTAQDAAAKGINLDWQPSPLSTIDGQEITDFLSQFAVLNARGTTEPHADLNQLMTSGAGDIQGKYTAFSGASPFYPGDLIEMTLENSSRTFPIPWLATYSIPNDTPPIYTGEDFYNFFVLGQYPPTGYKSSDTTTTDLPSAATSTASNDTYSTDYPTAAATTTLNSAPSSYPTTSDVPVPSASGWIGFSYPENPDVVQPNLGLYGGGILTGYILNESSTAVLSIPNFELTGEAIYSFSATVGEFLGRSLEAGMKKVVIDLQHNGGGNALLAADTFKQVGTSRSDFPLPPSDTNRPAVFPVH